VIGFLLGLAIALPIGVLMGAWAAAIYEERMGREVDRIFKEREPRGVDVLPFVNIRPEDAPPSGGLPMAAGVRVCSCIGALHGPHFVDSECPFHGAIGVQAGGGW